MVKTDIAANRRVIQRWKITNTPSKNLPDISNVWPHLDRDGKSQGKQKIGEEELTAATPEKRCYK